MSQKLDPNAYQTRNSLLVRSDSRKIRKYLFFYELVANDVLKSARGCTILTLFILKKKNFKYVPFLKAKKKKNSLMDKSPNLKFFRKKYHD